MVNIHEFKNDGTLKASKTKDPLQAFMAMHNAQSNEDAMMIACIKLRQRAGVAAPPFDLDALMRVCEAKKVETDLPIEGGLQLGSDSFIINLRKSDPLARKRFTIAHELGHILLYDAIADDSEALAILNSDMMHSQVERLCNLAAAEILVPRADFLRAIAENGFNMQSLEKMRTRYGVSHKAILRRFVDISDIASVSLWKLVERSLQKGDILRLVQEYHSSAGLVFPVGANNKQITPDILHKTARTKQSLTDLITIKTEGRSDIAAVAFSSSSPFVANPQIWQPKIPQNEYDVVLLTFPHQPSSASDPLLAALAQSIRIER